MSGFLAKGAALATRSGRPAALLRILHGSGTGHRRSLGSAPDGMLSHEHLCGLGPIILASPGCRDEPSWRRPVDQPHSFRQPCMIVNRVGGGG